MKIFEIDDDEMERFNKWNTEHKEICPIKNTGAIGGRLTFAFTPTGLGCITVVKCVCGKETTLTSFKDW